MSPGAQEPLAAVQPREAEEGRGRREGAPTALHRVQPLALLHKAVHLPQLLHVAGGAEAAAAEEVAQLLPQHVDVLRIQAQVVQQVRHRHGGGVDAGEGEAQLELCERGVRLALVDGPLQRVVGPDVCGAERLLLCAPFAHDGHYHRVRFAHRPPQRRARRQPPLRERRESSRLPQLHPRRHHVRGVAGGDVQPPLATAERLAEEHARIDAREQLLQHRVHPVRGPLCAATVAPVSTRACRVARVNASPSVDGSWRSSATTASSDSAAVTCESDCVRFFLMTSTNRCDQKGPSAPV